MEQYAIKEKGIISLCKVGSWAVGYFIVEIDNEIRVFYFIAPISRFDELWQMTDRMGKSQILQIGVCGNKLCRVTVGFMQEETFELMSEPKNEQELEGISGTFLEVTKMRLAFPHVKAAAFMLPFVEEGSLKLRVFVVVKPYEEFEHYEELFRMATDDDKKVDLTVQGDRMLDVIVDKDNHFEI